MNGQIFEFPAEQAAARGRARRIAWLSIVLLLGAGVLLALTLGQSQSMKTAWVSDIVTALPPVAFLIATRYELRRPTRRFPYGYFRAVSIAFLVTAGVLTVVGLYLLYDSLMKLVHGERPAIGTMELVGFEFWHGWAMVTTLGISLSIGMMLGKLKQPLAKTLHGKAIEAESRMNRAEWMSEGAAIVGILLVGFGLWWGDAVAAAFISIEIIRDGWHNVRQVIGDLMDEAPSKLGSHELEDIPARLKEAAERLPWVARAGARLREQGHILTGDVFVVPREARIDAATLVTHIERAAAGLRDVDWRLYGLTIMPVSRLEDDDPPRI